MSTQAKQLNDVPTVDIGPSTRILALDSSGAVGKGTLPSSGWQQSADIRLSPGKWYRVVDVNLTGVGTMAVMRYYHYTAPRNLLLSISFDAFGNITDGIDVRVLAGVPIHITKIRCVVDKYNTAWAGHIDIYVGGGTGAEITIVGLSGLGMRVCDIAEDPSIEGANLVKEFDLKSGGVIYCTAIGPYLVAYKEKGGPHEHICEEYGRSADKFQSDISVGADRGAGHKRGCVGVLESVALSAKGGFEHAYRNGTVSDYHGVICEFPVCGSRIHGAGISVRADKYRSDSDIRYVGHGNVHPQVQVRQLDSVGYIHYNKSANLITRKEVVAA